MKNIFLLLLSFFLAAAARGQTKIATFDDPMPTAKPDIMFTVNAVAMSETVDGNAAKPNLTFANTVITVMDSRLCVGQADCRDIRTLQSHDLNPGTMLMVTTTDGVRWIFDQDQNGDTYSATSFCNGNQRRYYTDTAQIPANVKAFGTTKIRCNYVSALRRTASSTTDGLPCADSHASWRAVSRTFTSSIGGGEYSKPSAIAKSNSPRTTSPRPSCGRKAQKASHKSTGN